jgi:hypothetical protein
MYKVRAFTVGVLLLIPALSTAQSQQATTQMAQKMESTCLGFCHGPSLIAQQRLERAGWSREVDKMILWGAKVADADKDALIDYLARTFNSNRPRPSTSKTVPEGKGMDIFQISCMSCHDDRPFAALKLDRGGWIRQVDRMINWGAFVPAARKEELIEYLLANF